MLTRLIAKTCESRIPRSGKKGEAVNCYVVALDHGDSPYFVATEIKGNVLTGLKWDGSSYAESATISISELEGGMLNITHYYGLSEVTYDNILDATWNYVTRLVYLKIHIYRYIESTSQYFFNKRKLITKKRMELLRLMMDDQLDRTHDGAVCAGSPFIWTSGNWSGKFTRTSDAAASVSPVLLAPGDPTGTYLWNVRFNADSQSVSRFFSVVNAPSPDLRVLSGVVSPSSVSAGGVISASWTIANQGSGTATASTTVVRINQSSTSAGGSNLASISTPGLAAGTSQSQSTSLNAPTTPGAYFVWVLADNFSTSGQSTSAAANDLVLIGSFIRN